MDTNFQTPGTAATSSTAATTSPPDQASPPNRQLGARWLTAAGGILVLLAAIAFVAVNWDRIGDEAKIISLAMATAGIGFAGWHLEKRLPWAATTLTHLSAALVPINVAAIAVNTTNNYDLTVVLTAWTAVLVSGLMIIFRKSILVEVAWVMSAPIAVISSARIAHLSDTDAGLLAIAIALPVWCIGTLTETRFARWAGYAFPIAGALSASAIAIMDESASVNAPFGAATMVIGLFVMLEGIHERSQEATWIGGGAMLVGWWILATLAGIQAIEAYLWPAGVLLLAPAILHLRQHPEASSWPAMLPGLGLLTVPPIAERLDGGSIGHLVAAVVVAVGAMTAGAWYRYGAALVVGTGALGMVTLAETWRTAVGVDTWIWLATAGAALIGAGIALERADTGPVAATRAATDSFQAAYR